MPISSKKIVTAVFLATTVLPAQPGRFDPGVLAMFGGRYDDMLICVATPAGVKGGPIADVMLTLRYGMTNRIRLGMDLPVMRPVLFGLAFSMLQFAPQPVIDWADHGIRGGWITDDSVARNPAELTQYIVTWSMNLRCGVFEE
jgi:hypothetical protein